MNAPASLLLLLDVSSPYDPAAVVGFLEALRAHPEAESIEVRPFGDGLLGPHFTWLPSGFVHPEDWMAALPGAGVAGERMADPLRGDSLWLAHAWRDLTEQPEIQDGRVQAVGFLTDLSRALPALDPDGTMPPSVRVHWFPSLALDDAAHGRLAAWGRDAAGRNGGPEALINPEWGSDPAAAVAGFVPDPPPPRRRMRP